MEHEQLTIPQEHARGTYVVRRWCVRLAIALLVLGAISNTIYLWNHCPLDLSEDESHYWEWSRHLDYGYYSKPPGIAWVLWVAGRVAALLGRAGSGAAMMPVLRMPAVLFGLLSGLLSFSLARRVFRDDRAGLAVILLSAAVPMFTVGSLLITIDSPMYLSWAATVYCLWRAVECRDNAKSQTHIAQRGIGWLYLAGAACAAGMMFKPVLIAIPICAAIAALADGRIRRALSTWHTLVAACLIPLSQVPTILWNSRHEWVTFRHIATQGGFAGHGEEGSRLATAAKNMGNFLGGQAGGMGGGMFVLLAIAVVLAWKRAARAPLQASPGEGTTRTAWVFLLSFTLPLWTFYFLMNLWKGTEVNWPAASYFTGMVLTAGIFVQGWNAVDPAIRKRWRMWGAGTVAIGILSSMIAMNLQRFYPLVAAKLAPLEGTGRYTKSILFPGKWDPAAKKLRGFQERAGVVQNVMDELHQQTGKDPLVITSRYDTSSSLAFYLPGQPFVFSIMSAVGGRHSQYDLWPGLDQKDSTGALRFAGLPAVIVGLGDGPRDQATVDAVLRPAFERLAGPERIPVYYHGIRLQELSIYRGYGFKGLPPARSNNY